MTRRFALLVIAACGVLPIAAPAAARAATATTATSCQADGNHVALVVDFGDHVDAQCVAITAKETGYQVLGDRARINGSGLVCAIDGVPATGCGDQTGDGHYAYWSYWHGTAANGWMYSSTGPSSRVSPSITEGWRWTPNGSANPNDPQPNWSADPAATCVPAPATTTAITTAPPTSIDEPAIVPSTTAPPVSAASTSVTTIAESSTTTASSSTSSSSSQQAAIARVNDNRSGRGSGSPVGVVVGLGLVAALAAGALALNRRRSASGP